MLSFFKPKPQMSVEEYELRLLAKGLSPEGFIPDPVPIAPPIGYKKQPSMVELIRAAVQGERLQLEAKLAGYETLEESEDFDIDDEPDMPRSRHEYGDDNPTIAELRQAVAEMEKARKAAAKPKEGGGGDLPADKPEPDESSGDPA